MSADFQEVILEDIAELSGGNAFKSEEYTDSGRFVLRTVNISDSGRIKKEGSTFISEDRASVYERFSLQENDTLFVMVGATLGKTGIVKKVDLPALLNQNMWRVRARIGKVDPLYLHYAFFHFSKPMSALVSGSARGFLKRDDFRNMKIHIPPITTQKEVAQFLGALDDRITLLRETNATLEAIAQALFKSWFVDFDPVLAKAEGRQPEGAAQGCANVASAECAVATMDTATAALFPDSFEESELGPIPKGWNRRSFTDTVKVIGGGTPKTSIPEYWGGEIPWFSVVDAPSITDVFVIDTAKNISSSGLNNSSTKLLPEGTTIISARGTVGRLALTGKEMAMNQSCYGLQGKAGDSYFTYFSTYRLVESLKQRSHGSVFDTITTETMRGVTVIYPDDSVIHAFEAILGSVMGRMKANLMQINTLTQLRDTLLPRLISGQLRLPDAAVLPTSAGVSVKTSGKTSGKILAAIQRNPTITIPELAARIGVAERTIERNLSTLQTAGHLRRVGPAKGGYWEALV